MVRFSVSLKLAAEVWESAEALTIDLGKDFPTWTAQLIHDEVLRSSVRRASDYENGLGHSAEDYWEQVGMELSDICKAVRFYGVA